MNVIQRIHHVPLLYQQYVTEQWNQWSFVTSSTITATFNPSWISNDMHIEGRDLLFIHGRNKVVIKISSSNDSFSTHWGRATHICVGKLTIIGIDNGLSHGRRQAVIWTNAGILLIRSLGTNYSEILIGIRTFWFKKMRLKVSSGKWQPFCLGLNVLKKHWYDMTASTVRVSPSRMWNCVIRFFVYFMSLTSCVCDLGWKCAHWLCDLIRNVMIS